MSIHPSRVEALADFILEQKDKIGVIGSETQDSKIRQATPQINKQVDNNSVKPKTYNQQRQFTQNQQVNQDHLNREQNSYMYENNYQNPTQNTINCSITPQKSEFQNKKCGCKYACSHDQGTNKNSSKTKIIILIIVIVVFIAILIYMVYKKKQRKQQQELQQELTSKYKNAFVERQQSPKQTQQEQFTNQLQTYQSQSNSQSDSQKLQNCDQSFTLSNTQSQPPNSSNRLQRQQILQNLKNKVNKKTSNSQQQLAKIQEIIEEESGSSDTQQKEQKNINDHSKQTMLAHDFQTNSMLSNQINPLTNENNIASFAINETSNQQIQKKQDNDQKTSSKLSRSEIPSKEGIKTFFEAYRPNQTKINHYQDYQDQNNQDKLIIYQDQDEQQHQQYISNNCEFAGIAIRTHELCIQNSQDSQFQSQVFITGFASSTNQSNQPNKNNQNDNNNIYNSVIFDSNMQLKQLKRDSDNNSNDESDNKSDNESDNKSDNESDDKTNNVIEYDSDQSSDMDD